MPYKLIKIILFVLILALSFLNAQTTWNLQDCLTLFFVLNNWQNANSDLIQSENEVLMQQKLFETFIGE